MASWVSPSASRGVGGSRWPLAAVGEAAAAMMRAQWSNARRCSAGVQLEVQSRELGDAHLPRACCLWASSGLVGLGCEMLHSAQITTFEMEGGEMDLTPEKLAERECW